MESETMVAPGPRGDRPRARGAMRFDRRFAQHGVPRLQNSSETKDRTEFLRLNELLTKIAVYPKGGAILREFHAGRLSMAQLRQAESAAGLSMLADLASLSESQYKAAVVAQVMTPAPPAAADVSPAPSVVVSKPTEDDPVDIIAHIRGPRASTLELIERPLWDAAIQDAIPRMDVQPRTADRYASSIRALRDRTSAFAMDERTFQKLADLSEAQWKALDALRRRLLAVHEIQELAAMKERQRIPWLQQRRVRIGAEVAKPLESLDASMWDAVAQASDFALGPRVFEAMERLRPSECEELRKTVRRFTPDMKVRDLVLVSPLDWKLIAASWGTSNADWNHMRRALSAVLTKHFHDNTRHPVRCEIIDSIPLLPEIERVPDLPPARVWSILEQLPEHARDFPLVLVITGLRIGEYEALEPHHLHHDSCRIEVPGTKTDSSYDYVEVAPELWSVVVRGIPSPYRYGWMRRIFREACERAGVEGITLHDLRHCHAQWALQNGAEEHQVQAQLRHKTIAMTRRYVRTESRRRVAQAAADFLMEAKPKSA